MHLSFLRTPVQAESCVGRPRHNSSEINEIALDLPKSTRSWNDGEAGPEKAGRFSSVVIRAAYPKIAFQNEPGEAQLNLKSAHPLGALGARRQPRLVVVRLMG